MKNIELKAQYPDLDEAEKIAQALGAEFKWRRNQVDTYFRVGRGRLKMRVEESEIPELISYFRPDSRGFKESEYSRLKVPEPELLKQMLTQNLGLLVVVKKTRALYLFKNIRIHLDNVENLGHFLEFEGVIDSNEQLPETESLLEDLRKKFKIMNTDVISHSYSNLLP